MTTIVVFLLVISLLVLVHELGHFVAAKLSNVYVHEFSLGLGPRLLNLGHDGETSYSIRVLPIGGFVKLEGEDMTTVSNKEIVPSRSFMHQNLLTRALILSGGVVMNFLLGLLLVAVVLMVLGKPVPEPALYIDQVQPDSPAQQAQLSPESFITGYKASKAENFQPVSNTNKFLEFVEQNRGNSVVFRLMLPDQNQQEVTLTPRKNLSEDQGAVGIIIQEAQTVSYQKIPWLKVLPEATGTSLRLVGLMIRGIEDMVGKLFTTGSVPQDIAGPVGIAKLTGQAAQQGFFQLLQFTALISINLAIVNLLPFPALDGGRLIFLGVELLAGKELTRQYEGWVHTIGFVILLILMGFVTYLDIERFF